MDLSKKRVTDYFELLDVDRDATKEQIQKAFMVKASIWHPDKAEEKDRDHYTNVYADLQTAYKILSDDNTRKQYSDSQQTTDLEFKFADRNVGYDASSKFRNSDGTFNSEEFNNAYTRTDTEQKEYDNLHSKYGQTNRLNNNELMDFLNRRDQQMEDLKQEDFFTSAGSFNNDNFNKVFDFMKDKQPGNALQAYEGDPTGLSSTGLAEINDTMSSIDLKGVSFAGAGIDDIVTSQCLNPSSDFSEQINSHLQQISDIQYGTENPLTNNELKTKMDAINKQREDLSSMKQNDFIVEPSEMEKMYPGLYAPLEFEGIESKVVEAPRTKPLIEKDSSKIRAKINEKKSHKK